MIRIPSQGSYIELAVSVMAALSLSFLPMFHTRSRGSIAALALTLGLFTAGFGAVLTDVPTVQKDRATASPVDLLIENIVLVGTGPHLAGTTRSYRFAGVDASTNWTFETNSVGATKGAGYFVGGYPQVNVSVPSTSCPSSFNLRFTKANGTYARTGPVNFGDPTVC